LIEQIKKRIQELLQNTDYNLYDVEETMQGKNKLVQVFITAEEGISIDDCVKVNKLLATAFDEKDIYDDPYMLEVASPGIERKLKELSHFKGAIGSLVKIKTISEHDEFSDTKTYEGRLLEVLDDEIQIDDHKIKIDDLEKAQTVFESKKGEKK